MNFYFALLGATCGSLSLLVQVNEQDWVFVAIAALAMFLGLSSVIILWENNNHE